MAVLAALLLLLVLAVAGLQWWLTSEIGRGLVESRLSQAMGRPVRLDGDFGIGLLPMPGARGTDLTIFSRDGRWTIVESGSYAVSMALWPLLRAEVDVVSVEIGDARIDLGRLFSEPTDGTPGGTGYFPIPEISDFELSDVVLFFDGLGSVPNLEISAFSVHDFRVDRAASVEADLVLVTGGGDDVQISWAGSLTLGSGGTVEAGLQRLDFEFGNWALSKVTGAVLADLEPGRLDVELAGTGGGQAFQLSGGIGWGRAFGEEDSGYAVESLLLVIGDLRLEGRGCLLAATPPQLNLEVHAIELDIDR
ncbi:MAG: AsmA family protein, partial [Xanthomonadales bacterium]|nr:AsmA family protein [Xanthomonadales bacterium]